ncbi:hypothetical protein ACFQX5_45550, partial [Streptomyces lutosisoli]
MAETDPYAPDLPRLAGELLLKSPEFARLWERYDVRGHSHGRKTSTIPRAATSPSAPSRRRANPPRTRTKPRRPPPAPGSDCGQAALCSGLCAPQDCVRRAAPFLFDLVDLLLGLKPEDSGLLVRCCAATRHGVRAGIRGFLFLRAVPGR